MAFDTYSSHIVICSIFSGLTSQNKISQKKLKRKFVSLRKREIIEMRDCGQAIQTDFSSTDWAFSLSYVKFINNIGDFYRKQYEKTDNSELEDEQEQRTGC